MKFTDLEQMVKEVRQDLNSKGIDDIDMDVYGQSTSGTIDVYSTTYGDFTKVNLIIE